MDSDGNRCAGGRKCGQWRGAKETICRAWEPRLAGLSRVDFGLGGSVRPPIFTLAGGAWMGHGAAGVSSSGLGGRCSTVSGCGCLAGFGSIHLRALILFCHWHAGFWIGSLSRLYLFLGRLVQIVALYHIYSVWGCLLLPPGPHSVTTAMMVRRTPPRSWGGGAGPPGITCCVPCSLLTAAPSM